MGINSFSFFKRKESPPKVSEETYPKTAVLRNHKDLLEKNSRKSVERFDRKFQKEMDRMFGPVGTFEGGVRSKEITEEEARDIKLFIEYASKRLAAGALSSQAFHSYVERGREKDVLNELAPANNVGHDSMHAMMAYARTGGASLVPAYMKIGDEKELYKYSDPAANLEESYVIAFARLNQMVYLLNELKRSSGLRGEDLIEAFMDDWESKHKEEYGFVYADPNYLRENRMPEFVTVIRNLLTNMEREDPDTNFAIHEFQRILAPLLERLRTQAQ